MAGARGSQAYLVQAKQSGKSVAVTKWQDTLFFSGGSIGPTSGTDQLSETDNTRNAGDYYVTQTAVEGAPECYVRDDSIHHILEYALGSAEHTGASDYTHTIKPAAALPYVTYGRMIGGLLYEEFNDCKVSELVISAGTASPLTATQTIMGRKAVRKTEEWKTELAPPAASSVAPLNFNQATVTLGGGATSLVSSFEATISNNVALQQTDDSVPFDVVEGTFAVTLGYDLIFESLKAYNEFHYESEAGTTQGPNISTTSAKFLFTRAAKNTLEFEFPKIAFTEFPVDPDPGGGPITVSVRAAAQRHASGFVVATVKNQVAT